MNLGVRGKLFLISLLLIVVAGGASGLFVEEELRGALEARIESELLRFARLSAEALEHRAPETSLHELADRLAAASDVRLTVIDATGRVLADSALSPDRVSWADNHGGRAEFVGALERGDASARRPSKTLGTEMLYAAVRFERAGEVGVVRVAMTLDETSAFIGRFHLLLIVAAGFGLLVAVFMSGLASHMMSRTVSRLVEHARALARGERDSIEVETQDEFGRLAKTFNQLANALERSGRKMAKEKDRFAAVLEGMSDAVIALSAKGRIKVINRRALELLGLDAGCIGKSLLEATRIPALHELTQDEAEGETQREFELASGRRVLASATPLHTAAGTVIVLRDVTEVRHLETIRKDFVANVSHELRTPVSVIRANAETLLSGALEDRARAPAFVQAILRNSERLSSLIADLLDLSRIEAGKYHLEIQSVGVDEAIRRALEAISPAAQKRHVSWDLTSSSQLFVMADPMALEQVLLNLLDNAVKYTKDGGKVLVRAQEHRGGVRVEVADDGPGIPPQHRKRIFERFYRVDPGRSRELGGTGLGLSIVKHLVESMGGTVGVEPASPHGSIFWFVLPKDPEARLRLTA